MSIHHISVPTCKIVRTSQRVYIGFFRQFTFTFKITSDDLSNYHYSAYIHNDEFKSFIESIHTFIDSLNDSKKRIFRSKTYFVHNNKFKIQLSPDQYELISANDVTISMTVKGLYFNATPHQLHPNTEAKLWYSITI